MSTTITAPTYKFPRRNTYAAGILVELLSGKKITNAQMMSLLSCPHAATAMSHLRDKCNWKPYLKQKGKSTISGMGAITYEFEYWFDSIDIMLLKVNDPRIEMFLRANRKP